MCDNTEYDMSNPEEDNAINHARGDKTTTYFRNSTGEFLFEKENLPLGKGFTPKLVVDYELISDATDDLSNAATKLYKAIARNVSHNNVCEVKVDTLASDLGIGISSVKKARVELRKARLVRFKRGSSEVSPMCAWCGNYRARENAAKKWYREEAEANENHVLKRGQNNESSD